MFVDLMSVFCALRLQHIVSAESFEACEGFRLMICSVCDWPKVRYFIDLSHYSSFVAESLINFTGIYPR